jgi:hypothetical protein
LTIITQLSIDRLEYLIKIVNVYQGPVSTSIFIQHFEEYKILQREWMKNEGFRKYTTIHLIFNLQFKELDNPRSGEKYIPYSYPVNYLRNVARKYSTTDYVFYIDCDFMVPTYLYQTIQHGKLK